MRFREMFRLRYRSAQHDRGRALPRDVSTALRLLNMTQHGAVIPAFLFFVIPSEVEESRGNGLVMFWVRFRGMFRRATAPLNMTERKGASARCFDSATLAQHDRGKKAVSFRAKSRNLVETGWLCFVFASARPFDYAQGDRGGGGRFREMFRRATLAQHDKGKTLPRDLSTTLKVTHYAETKKGRGGTKKKTKKGRD